MLYTSYQPGDEINWTIMMMNMKVALMTIMKMEDRVTGRGDLGVEGYPPDKVFIKDHFGDGGESDTYDDEYDNYDDEYDN